MRAAARVRARPTRLWTARWAEMVAARQVEMARTATAQDPFLKQTIQTSTSSTARHQQHRPSPAAPPVTSITARHQHHRPRAKLTKPRADPSATTRQARPPEEGLLRPHRRPPLSSPSPTPPSPPPARPAPPPPSPPMTVSAPIPFPAAQRWPPPQKRRGSVRQQRGQGRRPRTPQPQPPQPSLLSHNSTMTQRKYTIYLI